MERRDTVLRSYPTHRYAALRVDVEDCVGGVSVEYGQIRVLSLTAAVAVVSTGKFELMRIRHRLVRELLIAVIRRGIFAGGDVDERIRARRLRSYERLLKLAFIRNADCRARQYDGRRKNQDQRR